MQTEKYRHPIDWCSTYQRLFYLTFCLYLSSDFSSRSFSLWIWKDNATESNARRVLQRNETRFHATINKMRTFNMECNRNFSLADFDRLSFFSSLKWRWIYGSFVILQFSLCMHFSFVFVFHCNFHTKFCHFGMLTETHELCDVRLILINGETRSFSIPNSSNTYLFQLLTSHRIPFQINIISNSIWNKNSIHVLCLLFTFGTIHSLWQCTLKAMKETKKITTPKIKQYVNVFGLFYFSFFLFFILGNYLTRHELKNTKLKHTSHTIDDDNLFSFLP